METFYGKENLNIAVSLGLMFIRMLIEAYRKDGGDYAY
jgi:hypothetical protein